MPTDDKCICQICTCGRHRCPHNPEPLLKFGDDDVKGHSSEYIEIFKAKVADIERTQPIGKRSQLSLIKEPIDSNSSYAGEYKNWELGKPERVKQISNYQPPNAPFDADTTAKLDYPKWKLEKRKKRKQWEYVKPEGYFDGTTTNNADFAGKDTERIQANRPHTSQKLLEGQISGATTNKTDFQHLKSERLQPIRHKDELSFSGDAFDFATTNKNDFQGFKNNKMQPIKQQNELTLFDGHFEDVTTLKSEYPEWKVEPRKKRTKAQYVKPDEDYGGTTTNKVTFTTPKERRREAIRRPSSQKLYEGEFQGTSTDYNDFHVHKVDSVRPIRHKDEVTLLDGRFDNATTLKSEYPEWKIKPREKRKQQDYIKLEGKFDGRTTNNVDFITKPAEGRREAIRPPTSQKLFEGKFNGTTTNKKDFQVFKGETICPIQHKDKLAILDDPFQDATTLRNDYPDWQVQPREKRKQQQYIKPEGEFDYTTTSKVAFVSKPLKGRREAIRPLTSQKLFEGEFQGTTTNKIDFQALKGKMTQLI